MALDGLTDLAFNRVELHVASHTMLLCRDAHQEKPFQGLVCTIVDDLATNKTGMAVKHLLRLGFTCKEITRNEKKTQKKQPAHTIVYH